MKTKSLFVIFTLLSFFAKAQNQFPNKPLKTWNYSELKICNEVISEKFDVSDYKLSSDEEYYYATERIEVKAPETKWVSKPADNRNCTSPNPNDCFVWCLVEIPAEYKTVKTTISAEDVVIEGDKKFKREKTIETVCTDDISDEMFDILAKSLTSFGYIRERKPTEYPSDYKAFCREKLFDALVKYQKKYNFSEGFFSIQTLVSLGIVVY